MFRDRRPRQLIQLLNFVVKLPSSGAGGVELPAKLLKALIQPLNFRADIESRVIGLLEILKAPSQLGNGLSDCLVYFDVFGQLFLKFASLNSERVGSEGLKGRVGFEGGQKILKGG
jgi:hypothetical protein